MTLWILAVVLTLLFAAIGFFKGAVRMLVGVVGLIIGVMVAVPLGPTLWGLMPKIGIKNPVWIVLTPPAIVFIIVNIIFLTIAFVVHHKVALYYKYKRDDVDRLRFDRMNKRTGAAAGLAVGATFFFLICAGVIYPGGYLVSQVANDENDHGAIKFLRSARAELASSGLDKAAAKLDPATTRYYQAADVLGLLYHNPLLQARLAHYPYFLAVTTRSEFQEMSTDQEFNQLVFSKAPITQILNHQRTQALLGSKEVLEYVKGIDLVDLKEYLKEGKSKKYEETEILGIWNLDKDAIFTALRKANPDIKARELAAMRKAFEMIPTVSLTATPDNKVYLKADVVAAAAPAPDPAAAAPAPQDDMLAQRYGIRNQPAAAAPAAPTPAAPAPTAMAVPSSGEGAWKEESGQYIISLPLPTGGTADVPAIIKGDELTIQSPQMPLVFFKEEV